MSLNFVVNLFNEYRRVGAATGRIVLEFKFFSMRIGLQPVFSRDRGQIVNLPLNCVANLGFATRAQKPQTATRFP
jgi:hypothetical protein